MQFQNNNFDQSIANLITNSDETFANYCNEIDIHYLKPPCNIPSDATCFVDHCRYMVIYKHLYKPDTYSCTRHRSSSFMHRNHVKCRELGCFRTNRSICYVDFYCSLHIKKRA